MPLSSSKQSSSLFGRRDPTASNITLTNYNDFMYWTNLTIGSTNQTVQVSIDTGSHLLWVPSKTCNVLGNCSDTFSFDERDSTSYYNTSAGDVKSIQYGDGSGVSGYVSQETIQWGDVRVSNTTFLLVTKETRNANGVLGLACNSDPKGLPTIFQTMIGQELTAPVFSIWLNSVAANNGKVLVKDGGEVVLGAVDSSKYLGDLVFYTTTGGYFWDVPMSGVVVGNDTMPALLEGSTFLLDSGSSWAVVNGLYLRTYLLPLIYNSTAIPAPENTLYRIDCAFRAKAPSVSFVLGTDRYTLTAQEYILQNGPDCYVTLAEGADDLKTWILGDIFMRKYYSVFTYNYGNTGAPHIGLARSIGPIILPEPTTTTTVAPSLSSTALTSNQTISSASTISFNVTGSKTVSSTRITTSTQTPTPSPTLELQKVQEGDVKVFQSPLDGCISTAVLTKNSIAFTNAKSIIGEPCGLQDIKSRLGRYFNLDSVSVVTNVVGGTVEIQVGSKVGQVRRDDAVGVVSWVFHFSIETVKVVATGSVSGNVTKTVVVVPLPTRASAFVSGSLLGLLMVFGMLML
ncbi:hypothetical protein HDU79_001177 [Rhizoclosmatium sp. JEL0117]|nr:hypothetical protein HDU79_001177 [Rhizoclosmatium sp. JEL0117]